MVYIVIQMKGAIISTTAMAMAALMVMSCFTAVVSAAPESDPMDRIRLEQGTTNEFSKGSYVAVNCTQGWNVAWFGVVYGTEERPAPITIVGMNLRYLGGADVKDVNGNVIISDVPIPIVTVFGQQMFGLIEFDDTGIPTFFGETYGARNGLFDFTTKGKMFESDPTARYEAVYKYVDLNRAWTLSDIKTTVDYGNQTKRYDFSLYATNVSYSKVWNPQIMDFRAGNDADGSVERIEFAFHVTASAKEVTAEVPYYSVTVNNGQIISSEKAGEKNYTGISTNTAFKYDHILDGWDFNPEAKDPMLMLENGIIYAVFIPEKVEEWYNAQFVRSNVRGGSGTMTYFTDEGEQVAEQSDDVPSEATLLTKDRITFQDNWERTGALTWVSNVTVDGMENRMMAYQVHGADDWSQMSEKGDGHVSAICVLGGYIYPAGESIMHDPALEVGAFQLDMGTQVGGLVFVAVIGLLVIGVIVMTGAVLVRHRMRRRHDIGGRVPPAYRP
ncbi:MAG: hypothetical protein A4E32_00126 [Methanomassiliicoccales archaeon PtaU1.Bin124]|nr:MAG: hypothetical protein A4E32_00126 [Methanomassiliicoccales archaeon PtaU1.Bin124]